MNSGESPVLIALLVVDPLSGAAAGASIHGGDRQLMRVGVWQTGCCSGALTGVGAMAIAALFAIRACAALGGAGMVSSSSKSNAALADGDGSAVGEAAGAASALEAAFAPPSLLSLITLGADALLTGARTMMRGMSLFVCEPCGWSEVVGCVRVG